MYPESLTTVQTEIAGANLLLAAASPFQGLFDRPSITHEFLNKQAIAILSSDGISDCAAFFNTYLPQLNAGVYWADQGWKNVSHYYEPVTGKGLWRFATALDDFSAYFKTALSQAWQNNLANSAFFLGAAAHLVQDLCVPHHARAKLFSGHKEYENWVKKNLTSFVVQNEGFYLTNIEPYDLLVHNAVIAADYLDWVTEENHTRFHTVTTHLLSRAQQTTAGLFERFYTMAAIKGNEINVAVA